MNIDIPTSTTKKQVLASQNPDKNPSSGNRWNLKNQRKFLAYLNMLLTTGIPLSKGIGLCEKEMPKNLKPAIQLISKGIKEGQMLGNCLAEAGFGKMSSELVTVGEKTGKLALSLQAAKEQIDEKLELKKILTDALTYPTVIIVIALAVLTFMLKYLVPVFAETFKKAGLDLPPVTQFILSTSDFIGQYAPLTFLVFSIICSILYMNKKSEKQLNLIYSCLCSLPITSKVYQHLTTSRICGTLAHLLAEGIQLQTAMTTVGSILVYPKLSFAFNNAASNLTKGESVSEVFSKIPVLSGETKQLIAIGESSNSLTAALSSCNDISKSKLQSNLQLLKQFIEPTVIIILGLLVGFILVAMYMPVFSMGELAKPR